MEAGGLSLLDLALGYAGREIASAKASVALAARLLDDTSSESADMDKIIRAVGTGPIPVPHQRRAKGGPAARLGEAAPPCPLSTGETMPFSRLQPAAGVTGTTRSDALHDGTNPAIGDAS